MSRKRNKGIALRIGIYSVVPVKRETGDRGKKIKIFAIYKGDIDPANIIDFKPTFERAHDKVSELLGRKRKDWDNRGVENINPITIPN